MNAIATKTEIRGHLARSSTDRSALFCAGGVAGVPGWSSELEGHRVLRANSCSHCARYLPESFGRYSFVSLLGIAVSFGTSEIMPDVCSLDQQKTPYKRKVHKARPYLSGILSFPFVLQRSGIRGQASAGYWAFHDADRNQGAVDRSACRHCFSHCRSRMRGS